MKKHGIRRRRKTMDYARAVQIGREKVARDASPPPQRQAVPAKQGCLLDHAVVAHNPGLEFKPGMAAVWAQKINAKRFIFDKEASERIGEMMRFHLDLLVDNIEFARPPFPTTYVEVDLRAIWDGWRPTQKYEVDGDERLGFLIHHGTVLMACTGKRPDTERDPHYSDPMTLICGLSFRINRPQSLSLTKLTGKSEREAALVHASYVFGGQRIVMKDNKLVAPASGSNSVDGDHIRQFNESSGLRGTMGMVVEMPELIEGTWTHEQIAAHFDIVPALTQVDPDTFTELCFMSGGDPLFLTTALLLLNQPSKYVVMDKQPREVGLVRGNRKVFQEHHVVRLKLSHDVKVARIFNLTNRAPPRAHPVKGHWKHYNHSDGCDHHHPDQRQAWEPIGSDRTVDGDYKRYWCPLCLQRRTWTEHFHTGGSGIATTEYAVTR